MPKIIIIGILVFITVTLHAVPTNYHQRSTLQAQTYFREGIKQVKRQNYRGAIRSFRSAIQHDSKLGEAYLNLGACYERIGQFEKSIPYFEKAISVDEKNPHLVYLYGMVLGRNDKRKEAVKYLEKAVYMEPKNPDYLYNLGVGYSSLTQYAYAATCFEQVSGMVSNNSAVWHNLGLAKLHLNKTNEAVSAWEKVEIDSPVAAQTLYYLALAAYDRSDYKTAMSKLKMSLALEHNFIDAQYLKADLLGKKKEYSKAIELLEKIYLIKQESEVEKKIALFYVEWAEMSAGQKEYQTALHRFRQAGRFMPKDPDIQINIAEAAFKAEKYNIAKQALERAQDIAVTAKQEELINELRMKHVVK